MNIPFYSYLSSNSRSISDVLFGFFSAGINRSGLIFMLGKVWLDSVISGVFSSLFWMFSVGIFMLGNVWLDSVIPEVFSSLFWMFSVGHGTRRGQIPICSSGTELHHEGKTFSWWHPWNINTGGVTGGFSHSQIPYSQSTGLETPQ